MNKLILVVGFIFISGYVDQETALRVLSSNGYINIQITGYSPFSCSEYDFNSRGFIAKSPNGQQVRGAICTGIPFKNATIRFE